MTYTNCFGNEIDSRCILYNGKPLHDFLNEKFGESSGSAGLPLEEDKSTSDDIISLANSELIDANSPCALQITKRHFSYSLESNRISTIFSYDLTETLSSLPENYNIASIKVRAYGKVLNNSSLISETTVASSGFEIKIDRYPVTVDINVRIITPCGNIDLSGKVYLEGVNFGSFKSVLDVKDLNYTIKSDISLTQHLNNISSGLRVLKNKVDTLDIAQVMAAIANVDSQLQSLSARISALE